MPKTKSKSAKRKPAPRTNELDPRLARIFFALEASADDDQFADFIGLSQKLLAYAAERLPSADGYKAALAAIIERQTLGNGDKEDALNNLVEIVNEEHRKCCSCCAARRDVAVAS